MDRAIAWIADAAGNKSMNRFSVRARLTLWNVGIVALILITLGIGVRTIVRTSLMTGIDRELTERAENLRDDWSRKIVFEKGQFFGSGVVMERFASERSMSPPARTKDSNKATVPKADASPRGASNPPPPGTRRIRTTPVNPERNPRRTESQPRVG
jgi:hypothetical protein